MKKILLVEDNKSIALGLEYSLKQEGFSVTISENVFEAKKQVGENEYDLGILDLTLPDGNGYELFEYIKANNKFPCIFLTAMDDEVNVVMGLDLGAEDYITKPFRIKELISRIRNILKRSNNKEIGNVIKVKNIELDISKMQVLKKNEDLLFTVLEYKILLMLFSNVNQIITREQILDKIWDEAGNFVNDNTLTVYIKRIREKVEDNPSNPEIIKTIRGIGYKVEV